jgi:hypothetical protein
MKKHKSEEDREFDRLISIHFITIVAMVAAIILAEQILNHIPDIEKFYLLTKQLILNLF